MKKINQRNPNAEKENWSCNMSFIRDGYQSNEHVYDEAQRVIIDTAKEEGRQEALKEISSQTADLVGKTIDGFLYIKLLVLQVLCQN